LEFQVDSRWGRVLRTDGVIIAALIRAVAYLILQTSCLILWRWLLEDSAIAGPR
jgi:hypothetical protein